MSSGWQPQFVFICTHNSRRSQAAQIWAQTAACYFGIPAKSYSGGTEQTLFEPKALKALERVGFIAHTIDLSSGTYSVSFSPETESIICFSKKSEDPVNPQKDFIAFMTCSQADENCPVVKGAIERFSLAYEDPKVYDGSSSEESAYNECCQQIGRDLFYLFSLLV